MKTNIEISNSLLREAQKIAAREGTTLRALVEQGLRQVIAEKKRRAKFHLRKASFGGRGLRPELRGESGARLRELSYQVHGN
jgi:Bacterial antitoxin of type II TA system, VapB